MKDTKKREKGKYKEDFIKIVKGQTYHMIEEYTIGRDNEIISFSREIKPPVPYPMEWDDIK